MLVFFNVEGFVIASEESVSKGIRRITALTGHSAKFGRSRAEGVEQLITISRSADEAQLPVLAGMLQRELAEPKLPLRARRRGQAFLAELQAKQKAFEKSQRSATPAVDVPSVSLRLVSLV